eukprot:807992-Pyramimonas_sp.AAC.1
MLGRFGRPAATGVEALANPRKVLGAFARGLAIAWRGQLGRGGRGRAPACIAEVHARLRPSVQNLCIMDFLGAGDSVIIPSTTFGAGAGMREVVAVSSTRTHGATRRPERRSQLPSWTEFQECWLASKTRVRLGLGAALALGGLWRTCAATASVTSVQGARPTAPRSQASEAVGPARAPAQ